MNISQKITEVQFFDYMRCPTYYNAIHDKHIFLNDKVSMNTLLNKVADYFYINLMNGKIVSPGGLKKKWDKICEENPSYITPQRSLEGMSLLMKMFNWAQREQVTIGDIKVPYSLTYKVDNKPVDFFGEIGVLACRNQKDHEILVTDFSNRIPDRMLMDMNMKYTMDCNAIKKLYRKDIVVHIHNVKNDKDFYTSRNIDDYNRLEDAIKNISICIDKKLFYPRETFMCSSCDLKGFCKAWSVSKNL